jgi:hypothetical protein
LVKELGTKIKNYLFSFGVIVLSPQLAIPNKKGEILLSP